MNFIKNRKLFSYLFVFLFSCFFALSANICLAQSSPKTILPGTVALTNCNCGSGSKTEACKQYCGDYGLNDFVQLAINASGWILGIVGSLTLLMFVYGGVMFLISAGSSERVTQAKGIIVGAVIGIAIVFTSYMIIGFVFKATGADTTSTAWSNVNWFSKK